MDQDLLEIINHYGVLPQLEYYQTEIWELNEAIIIYENEIPHCDPEADEGYIKMLKKHIAEELGDNFVMLYQFDKYYKLNINNTTLCLYKAIKPKNEYEKITNILEYSKDLARDIHKLGKEIIEYELRNEEYYYSDEDKGDMELLIKDKLLIVLDKLKHIQAYYEISDKTIEVIMKFKIARQLRRMKNGRDRV